MCNGKKAEGFELGTTNSNDPDLLEESIRGNDQVNIFFLDSCKYWPSHSLTIGLEPIGNGMIMWTSFNSRSTCSNSYSIFTSHPPSPFSEGQQFTGKSN